MKLSARCVKHRHLNDQIHTEQNTKNKRKSVIFWSEIRRKNSEGKCGKNNCEFVEQ